MGVNMNLNSTRPSYEFQIRIEGRIPQEWQDWFSGLSILPDGEETLLVGSLPDHAALQGVLTHLASLNLALISVERKLKPSQEK
jgi:hypothetical protein